MDFEVSVKNKVLGDSTRIMSMKQIMDYNICALSCAQEAARTGKPSTCGMWTVSPIISKPLDPEVQDCIQKNFWELAGKERSNDK